MPGDELGLGLHQLGEQGPERFGDLRVQSPPGAAQQRIVRRVLHQRVFEAIDCVGWRAALEHQFGGDEAGERGLQFLFGKAGDGVQQRVGELAADCGANLRHTPYRRQAVEPRQQRRMKRRRDGKCRQSAIEHVSVAFLAQEAALEDVLGKFLDEQRHAVGAVDDLVDDLIG